MKRNIFIIILLLLLALNITIFILPDKYEYNILTMQTIEQRIYNNLKQQGAAEEVENEKNKLKITDIEKAKSQNSMPPILNELGQQGWRLTGINKDQLYIFKRNTRSIIPKKWEYKVLSFNDINKKAIDYLIETKAITSAEVAEGKERKLTIVDQEKAKLENIMPIIFNKLAEDGWELNAINKAQLYILSRSVSLR